MKPVVSFCGVYIILAILSVIGVLGLAALDYLSTESRQDTQSSAVKMNRDRHQSDAPISTDDMVPSLVEVSVGATYGSFFRASKVTNNLGKSVVVEFDGSDDVAGTLVLNSLPSVLFTVDPDHVSKLPRVCRGDIGQPQLTLTLVINDPSPIKAEDFSFVSDGNSTPRRATVRLTNLKMSCPRVNAFGSADAIAVTYTEG